MRIKKWSVYLIILLLLSLPVCFGVQISYQYDANGNLIQDERHYYEYNGFNQLARVREGQAGGTILEEYFYDGEGNRVLKIDYEDTFNESTYYPDNNFVQVVNGTSITNTTYYYSGNLLLAHKNGTGVYYYHSDHLGSTTLITNQLGNKIEETKYGPFGDVLSGGNNRYLYIGKELDDIGLYYYGARYYKENFYHFSQPDTIIQEIYDPQNLNRFAYVRNNPYKYVDPTGNYIETGIDIASLAWSIHDVKANPKSTWNWAALAADVGTLALPTLAAGGTFVRGAKGLDKIDNLIDTTKVIKPVLTEKSLAHITLNHVDEAAKPWKSKFMQNTNLQQFAEEVISKGEKSTQVDGRLSFTADLGRVVGTKGETGGKVVLESGTHEVVTQYPVKTSKTSSPSKNRNPSQSKSGSGGFSGGN